MKLAHDGDHARDEPVQLVCADHQIIQGAAAFAVEFLHLSKRKLVGGEDMDLRSWDSPARIEVSQSSYPGAVTNNEVPTELFEVRQVR